jgi:hypothetical protein
VHSLHSLKNPELYQQTQMNIQILSSYCKCKSNIHLQHSFMETCKHINTQYAKNCFCINLNVYTDVYNNWTVTSLSSSQALSLSQSFCLPKASLPRPLLSFFFPESHTDSLYPPSFSSEARYFHYKRGALPSSSSSPNFIDLH